MDRSASYGNIACVILSGGFSQRMQVHKALLPFSKTECFLQHLISVYNEAGINNISVVLNHDIELGVGFNLYGAAITLNHNPSLGRLYSLQLGLGALPDIDFCFVQNVDSPFVTKELIGSLITSINGAENITPAYNGKGGHPILISKNAIDEIRNERNYEKILKDVLSKYTRQKVEMGDGLCLVNINTPEEYKMHFGAVA